MKAYKCFAIAVLSFSMLFLTGCWNYREVDTLSIVAGFAVDKGDQGYKYHMTFEMLDFSSSGTKNGTVKPQLLETDGDTIFDAVRNAVKKSGKKLFFSDCKAVVISQDLAREGISPLMDWINRDSEPRITVNLVVSKESTARDILFQKAVTDQIVSYEIDKTLKNDALHLAKTPLIRLYQANDMLYGNGVSLSLPTIKVSASQSGKTPELDGTAIFKQDRLVGFLDNDQSKYMLFIEDKVQGGLLLVSQDSKDKNISLEILESHTKAVPLVANGHVSISISINVKVALGEMEGSYDYATESGIRAIEANAQKELTYGIEGLISQVQSKYDSDIFGFGKAVYQNNPGCWNEIKPKWGKMFQSLPVQVSVNIEIRNTATTQANVKVGD